VGPQLGLVHRVDLKHCETIGRTSQTLGRRLNLQQWTIGDTLEHGGDLKFSSTEGPKVGPRASTLGPQVGPRVHWDLKHLGTIGGTSGSLEPEVGPKHALWESRILSHKGGGTYSLHLDHKRNLSHIQYKKPHTS
jgi:hypothetical protein